MEVSELRVIKDNVVPKIQKVEIFGHKGYAAFSGKKGVFVYRDVGTYKGSAYDKVRVCLVYKSGKNVHLQFRKLRGSEVEKMEHQERLGIPLDMVAVTKSMMDMAINESGYSGNTPHIPTHEEAEQSEIDDMMTAFNPKGGKL